MIDAQLKNSDCNANDVIVDSRRVAGGFKKDAPVMPMANNICCTHKIKLLLIFLWPRSSFSDSETVFPGTLAFFNSVFVLIIDMVFITAANIIAIHDPDAPQGSRFLSSVLDYSSGVVGAKKRLPPQPPPASHLKG